MAGISPKPRFCAANFSVSFARDFPKLGQIGRIAHLRQRAHAGEFIANVGVIEQAARDLRDAGVAKIQRAI
jgi:hypothetical protein